MSLTKHFTNNELSRARDQFLSLPNWHHFLNITETIKIELDGSLPSNQLRLYSYTAPSATYWFAQRNFELISKQTYAAVIGKLIDDELEEAFLVFNVEERLVDHTPRKVDTTSIAFGEKLIALIIKHGGPSPRIFGSLVRFYMTPQQMQMTKYFELVVPEGYELGSASVEDADFINSHWNLAEKGDSVETRRRIQSFPSSVIRFNGEVVAFAMVDASGEQRNRWVKPDLRRMGFGLIVDMDRSKKLISHGFQVYKQITTKNISVLNSSFRSKYFTTSTNEDGSIAHNTYCYI